MSFVRIRVLVRLVLLWTVPSVAVPVFDINLDLPPEQRWEGVANYYRSDIMEMITLLGLDKPAKTDNKNSSGSDLNGSVLLGGTTLPLSDDWLNSVAFDPEYAQELQGFARAIGHPAITMERLKWLNMLYELHGPNYVPGCTSVLWANSHGTVFHGRNADDDSPGHSGGWMGRVMFDAKMHRSGLPLMQITTFPGAVGVHTGMRFGHKGNGKGWSFAQHARRAAMGCPDAWYWTVGAAAVNGQVGSLAVRRIMETTDDYDKAVNFLQNIQFMAPHYFIVSGSGPKQGLHLSVERLGLRGQLTPPIKRMNLNLTSPDPDDRFLVATNDEPFDIIPRFMWDPRRQLAHNVLESIPTAPGSEAANENNVLQLMHTNPILNQGTVHTTVMVPSTGYYKTVLPTEAPGVVDAKGIASALSTFR